MKFVQILGFIVALGCSRDFGSGQIDEASLSSLPHVVNVESPIQNRNATRQIIHILDWHLVSEDAFAADLRSQGIAEDEIPASYEQHHDEVERVQAEIKELLEAMIERHDITAVYMEGLSNENKEAFDARVAALRAAGPRLDELRAKRSMLLEPGRSDLDALLRQYRIDQLRLGAAGQLYMEGKLTVLSVESDEAHRTANPVNGDAVAIDEAKMAARDEAIVKNLMEGPPVAVVVLGAAHDLTIPLQQHGVWYARLITTACLSPTDAEK